MVENQNTVTELTSYGAVEEKTGRRTAKVSQIGEVGRETFTQNERKRVERERLLYVKREEILGSTRSVVCLVRVQTTVCGCTSISCWQPSYY